MNESRVREWYAEGIRRRSQGGREGCVSPDAIEALVFGGASEECRFRTLDHVMACEACEREFELLRSTVGATPHRSSWQPWGMAAAAAVVLAFGAGLIWQATRRGPAELVREGSSTVALVTPVGEVGTERLQLVWRAVRSAERYRVEVLTAAGHLVFATRTSDTTVTVPDSVALTPGEFFWWVQASLEDGDEIRSDLARFTRRSP